MQEISCSAMSAGRPVNIIHLVALKQLAFHSIYSIILCGVLLHFQGLRDYCSSRSPCRSNRSKMRDSSAGPSKVTSWTPAKTSKPKMAWEVLSYIPYCYAGVSYSIFC